MKVWVFQYPLVTGTFQVRDFVWLKIPILFAGIVFLLEIIRRKVQKDKAVGFNSLCVEVRGVFVDQQIESCILNIHLDAQFLNRMKIAGQRESKRVCKLIY